MINKIDKTNKNNVAIFGIAKYSIPVETIRIMLIIHANASFIISIRILNL